MVSLKYKQQDVTDFDSLIEQPFDLKSPFRSTVPHLAYWSNPHTQLAEFGTILGLSIPGDASLTFEYTVPPQAGRGKASHTDLMIVSSRIAIATEGKYTEPAYENVATWLGEPPTQNKLLVLGGWLDLISRTTGCQLTVEQVSDCTYQLVHRTASVCSVYADRRVVLYHGFDLADDRQQHYKEQLAALADIVAAPDKLRFVLVTNTLHKSEPYAHLQEQWQADPGQDYSVQVRRLLNERNIATFGNSVVPPLT